ncbi:Trm112p-domain-containing protein [Lepidopterella palustris CBS 459.81]|uniref:Trm112p-domain-containing protein n=1 Tax=Lepidopterella palustris CBS 459.81 TaxID=1314670 RepID=A0A8E2JAZ1_9PEZI|nr:Trm112p-domain-containing protein [Lepidopterella palustris CBS 459.81]
MKILTLNFLTCARKACKAEPAAFPLHPRDAELEIVEAELNTEFLRNVLPRVEWEALRVVTEELGLPSLPNVAPEPDAIFPAASTAAAATANETPANPAPTQLLQDLHHLLLETTILSGKLVCGNCGHEYAVKEGIANFLLPSHLV